ncbi:MAG: hypothetical protein JOZ18_14900 [Chloroflexi bacterium]|nr:hypothetical protein [Chloroflexota bacterium]
MSKPSDSFSSESNQDQVNDVEEPVIAPPGMPEETVAPEQTSVPSSESMLPPEAQGEANGGPLGCCLGIMIGLLLSLTIAVFSRFYADPLASAFSGNLSLIVRIVMALVAIIAAIVCGYFGWKIGKKVYREYESPVIKDRRKRTKSASKPKRA